MSYLKTVSTNTEVIVSEDGEVLDVQTKRHKIVVHSQKEYFATYSSFIGVLKDLSGAAHKVITYMIMYAPINDPSYSMNNTTRERMCAELGIKDVTVKKALKELVEKGVLLKPNLHKRSGFYTINPNYFWKGDMNGRNKAMKTILELEYIPQ